MIIKKILIVLPVLISVSVFAESEIWKMGDHYLHFYRDSKTDILISKFCENKKCEASAFLSIASFKKLGPEKFSGGKNPGAVICHESQIGEVVFLQDLNGNDNSFCLFKDSSMTTSSSLAIAASKNDKN